jgi:hypothetical protein
MLARGRRAPRTEFRREPRQMSSIPPFCDIRARDQCDGAR